MDTNGPPHTRQSYRILAAFRPWGGSGDAVARGTANKSTHLSALAHLTPADCGFIRIAGSMSARPNGCPEDSHSGLVRTLGKRVGCKPSGVRIPHPPLCNKARRRRFCASPFCLPPRVRLRQAGCQEPNPKTRSNHRQAHRRHKQRNHRVR